MLTQETTAATVESNKRPVDNTDKMIADFYVVSPSPKKAKENNDQEPKENNDQELNSSTGSFLEGTNENSFGKLQSAPAGFPAALKRKKLSRKKKKLGFYFNSFGQVVQKEIPKQYEQTRSEGLVSFPYFNHNLSGNQIPIEGVSDAGTFGLGTLAGLQQTNQTSVFLTSTISEKPEVNVVLVVPVGFPLRKFSDSEAEDLKLVVVERICVTADGTRAPTFRETYAKDGMVVFECSEEWTEGWLKAVVSEIKLQGELGLKTISWENLKLRNKVMVHAEPWLSVEQVIRLIDLQNKGLEAWSWNIVEGEETKNTTGLYFSALIADLSLEVLNKLDYRPFCGLGRAWVNLVNN